MTSDKPREFVTVPNALANRELALAVLGEPGIEGLELFATDIVPRNEVLVVTDQLVADLVGIGVKRLHCSYWGSPTNFLMKVDFAELVERFGGRDALREYYGDLTGSRMLRRWVTEYRLASEIGAQAYVFHLIDYMTEDGSWSFSIDKELVRTAMASMLQMFLAALEEEQLLSADSPLIEIENAGWGLEHGMQTADHAVAVLREISDPHGRVRLGWDLNHLLHALGSGDGSVGEFQLPEAEITSQMRELLRPSPGIADLADAWVASNVLDGRLAGAVGSIQVSDCPAKTVSYFENGSFVEPYSSRQRSMATRAERADFGLAVVLEHYDNHVPVGDGMLVPDRVADLISRGSGMHPELVILHELKNSEDLLTDLRRQRAALGFGR